MRALGVSRILLFIALFLVPPGIRGSSLPIVRLWGAFSNDYSPGTAQVIEDPAAEGVPQTYLIKAKYRGGTTNTPGKHKRNFHIKFIDENGDKLDRSFFSLRSDNSWILDAAQLDFSRVRNRVATDLWNDFATKPYYYNEEPKARTGTRGRFVEVFVNDEYMGIYTLTEAMDRKQLKLKKTDEETSLFHGFLYKCSGFSNALSWATDSLPAPTDLEWGETEVKYPEAPPHPSPSREGEYNSSAISLIIKGNQSPLPLRGEDGRGLVGEDGRGLWQPFIAATAAVDSVLIHGMNIIKEREIPQEAVAQSVEDFRDTAPPLFDIPVLADYFLFTALLHALDNQGGKNLYWACYDYQQSPMLTPAVWDLDCTVGGYFDPSLGKHPENRCSPESPVRFDQKLFYALDRYNISLFHDIVQSRYDELRHTFFSEEQLLKRYNDAFDLLRSTGAYTRDSLRWTGDTDIACQPLDYEEERRYINDWIRRRLLFLDKNLSYTLEQFITKRLHTVEVITHEDPSPQSPNRSRGESDSSRAIQLSTFNSQLSSSLYITDPLERYILEKDTTAIDFRQDTLTFTLDNSAQEEALPQAGAESDNSALCTLHSALPSTLFRHHIYSLLGVPKAASFLGDSPLPDVAHLFLNGMYRGLCLLERTAAPLPSDDRTRAARLLAEDLLAADSVACIDSIGSDYIALYHELRPALPKALQDFVWEQYLRKDIYDPCILLHDRYFLTSTPATEQQLIALQYRWEQRLIYLDALIRRIEEAAAIAEVNTTVNSQHSTFSRPLCVLHSAHCAHPGVYVIAGRKVVRK